MKITVEIDATPQEVREFFGLPDVQSLQNEIIHKVSDDLKNGTSTLDAFNLMKPFLPAHLQSMETLQNSFWNAFQHGQSSGDTETEDDPDKPA